MEHSLAAKQDALSNLQRYRNRPIIAAIKQVASNNMSRQIGFIRLRKTEKVSGIYLFLSLFCWIASTTIIAPLPCAAAAWI